MKSSTSFFAGGLAIAALLAPAARADDAPPAPAPAAAPVVPPSGRFFDTYDTNQDGKVTKEEFLSQKGDEEVFALLDKNGDGVVSLDELGLPADYKPTHRDPPREEPMGGPGGRFGGGPGERLKKLFDEFDTNHDGKITKEEYKGKVPFEFLDKNKDGVISAEDFRGMKPGGMPSPEEAIARFKEMDKNGDGKVTKEEFTGPPERFEMLDANHDGAITMEEVQEAFKAAAGKGEKGGDRMLMRMDANGDGKISREEFKGSDEVFKELDKNGDGFITEDELPTGKPGKELGKEFKKKKGEPGEPGKPGEPGMPPPAGGEMPAPPGQPPPPQAGSGDLPPLFAILDKNHDGKITRDEFPGTDDEWRKLDKDGNGWITPDEVR